MPDAKGRFQKGEGGRKPGSLNKSTIEIKDAAKKLLEDPEYVAALKLRLKRGTAGQVEPLLYHYAYGKPRETVQIEGDIPPFILRVEPDDEPDE